MEVGVYHEFHCRPDQTQAAAFAEALDQIEAADRWGLDAIWLAEIHQQARRSVMSAPMTVASAIAARTKRIKIGTGVQVLPLCHPLRLAEETATVDQISNGRLLFGVGRSGNPRSYMAYGVPYSESRERFLETLEIVKRGVDAGAVFLRGQVLAFRQCQRGAAAFSASRSRRSASPPPARRRFRHWAKPAIRSLSRCAAARCRGWRPISPPTAKPTERPATPGEGEVYLRLTLHIADTDRRGVRRSRGEHHVRLSDLEHPARRRAQPPPRGRGGHDPHDLLRRGAARQGHHRQPRAGRRPPLAIARGAGPRRHPCRAEFRRADPARSR